MFGLGMFELIILGGGAVVVVLVIALILFFVLSAKKPTVDPDAGLDEDLSQYPPAPKAGTHQLQFEGQAVRLRFVVLTGGKTVELDNDMAEGVLQSVVHGLGEVADLDKPRIKIWPPQLSHAGFAATFFRHVDRPEPVGKPSRWILAAGPAKVGGRQMLVGLAMLASESSTRGNVSLDAEDWTDMLRINVVG